MSKEKKYIIDGKDIGRKSKYIPLRYVIAFLITIISVLAVIGIVVALCFYVPYFYILAYLTEIGCVIKIISSDYNPDYKVPWLLFVLILPIAGFMIYFMFYSRRLKQKYVNKLKRIHMLDYDKEDGELLNELNDLDDNAYRQAKMICSISDSHVFKDTSQKYFASGEEMWKSMLDDIRQAKTFVYMEFFIIENGLFFSSILEILKEKAKAGVVVKIVYDDIGCMKTLPGNISKKLKKFGISVVPFSRVKGSADSEFNNRNHRKMLIIDGVVGYTGGINIADEYINVRKRFGHWKDSGIRLEGEAVWDMTKLFMVDYGMNVKENYIPTHTIYPEKKVTAKGFVVPFGDGPAPLYNRGVGKLVIQNMLANATKYAYITTPYLIIDNDMCQSIESAALRGVDVRIILPHVPDKKIIFSISQSFYNRLMNAGVRIYEYEPGFVHAKNYLVDDKYGMIGTINLDYRSLVHHFENGVWMYDTESLVDMKNDLLQTLEKSIEIKPEMIKMGWLKRFFRSIIRIFAPLM